MEQRLANTWQMTMNEKKFIETALESGLRIDRRHPFDYRELEITFGKDDGSTEVHLGQTHVMAFVTSQLLQPYKDRPNEVTLSIFTEFSPMADPSIEPGRPGESVVELGRVIDRGLRESCNGWPPVRKANFGFIKLVKGKLLVVEVSSSVVSRLPQSISSLGPILVINLSSQSIEAVWPFTPPVGPTASFSKDWTFGHGLGLWA